MAFGPLCVALGLAFLGGGAAFAARGGLAGLPAGPGAG
jgi:hypothetical protein